MYRKRGFTLIELVASIATLTLLIAIGVPSYRELAKNNAISTANNEVLAGLLLARSEAVRQETKITFTPKNKGWLVKSGDETLLDHTFTGNHVTIAGQDVKYNARGRTTTKASQPDGTSQPDEESQSIKVSYNKIVVSRVCLSLSGRPFIKKNNGDCP
jgi:type IV fimbrial biogenesis protein FimT